MTYLDDIDFGEIRVLAREDIENRTPQPAGFFQPIEVFDLIGKTVRFEHQNEAGIIEALCEDDFDYGIKVRYSNGVIYHSPLERYEIIYKTK